MTRPWRRSVANLFDPPGRPFGYAWLEERTKIEDHVRRRTHYQIPLYDMRLQDRVRRIQDRLHKYDPTFAERSRQWREQQAREWADRGGPLDLTTAELQHLVDLFDGANDPLSQSIAAKAAKMLGEL